MPKIIPAETRIQQINALPNITFVRWADNYRNCDSKAVCRCAIDGFEWAARVLSVVKGHGCPQCAGNRRWTAEERVAQINSLPNIKFIRWLDGYSGAQSKAVCGCEVSGHEWSASVDGLVNSGTGCPQCSGTRKRTSSECISLINALPNISFVRWDSEYRNNRSNAVVRCGIDGCEWSTRFMRLLRKETGCPQCAGQHKWTAEERIVQINALPGLEFVRWDGVYNGAWSKAVCVCHVAGHEWATRVSDLVNNRTGCPRCAEYGYNKAKPGTLYFLRSECGCFVKIGISNNYEQRHGQLRRATPFDWSCVEMLHGDGDFIAELEKELHSWTQPAEFKEKFDGFTEWRKWDDRLPRWIARFRLKVEAR